MTALAPPPEGYVPPRTPWQQALRRVRALAPAAPAEVQLERGVVSFTFDDFPASAARAGAQVLERAGGRATFYAAMRFSGGSMGYAEGHDPTTMLALAARGHEIGCHTFSHYDCARTPVDAVLADCEANAAAARAAGLTAPFETFAYPYGETTFSLKRAIAKRYGAARGVLAGLNIGVVDRAHLRCAELTERPDWVARAQDLIADAAARKGWAIFLSHDVSDAPTRLGLTPATLERLATAARDSGCLLLPVRDGAQLAFGSRP
jgi:peptidoglycan/xylan/chitin deacetylase (PgdA/CDA1 family)